MRGDVPIVSHRTHRADASVHDVEDRTPAALERLRVLVESGSPGVLHWHRFAPSAAFGRLDAANPGFPRAVQRVRDAGFVPFIRPVGGRLAAYHHGVLVVDLLIGDASPRERTTARFRTFAGLVASGLRRLGVDARVGAVPGEYCPGEWSVNAGGAAKIVGTGQRLTREAVLLTALVVVAEPDPLRTVMTDAYHDLGLAMDPATVGAVAEVVAGVTTEDVVEVLGATLAEGLVLDRADIDGSRRMLLPWRPA